MQKVETWRATPLAVAMSFVVAMCAAILLVAGHASAATSFARVMVRFDHMKISTGSTGMVCAQPNTTSANVKTWTVTFPTGYTVSTTAANWQTTNISTTNLPSGASAWPNATAATASVSGQTVTWTNASVQSMSTGTLYCYNWTSASAVSVKSSATSSNGGSVATQDNVAATIDSGSYSTASVADDAIIVSATVSQTFQFALSANADNLGSLSTGSVTTSPTPRTATVSTNAKNGYYVWAQDSNAGLTSASASKTITTTCSGGAGTNATLSAGTEGYNLGVTTNHTSGTGTITSSGAGYNFDGTAAGQGGGLCSTNFQVLATSNGTASNDVITLKNNAAISSTTPSAADYTDTITVVGAGLF